MLMEKIYIFSDLLSFHSETKTLIHVVDNGLDDQVDLFLFAIRRRLKMLNV